MLNQLINIDGRPEFHEKTMEKWVLAMPIPGDIAAEYMKWGKECKAKAATITDE